jgi:hypothetical protein
VADESDPYDLNHLSSKSGDSKPLGGVVGRNTIGGVADSDNVLLTSGATPSNNQRNQWEGTATSEHQVNMGTAGSANYRKQGTIGSNPML